MQWIKVYFQSVEIRNLMNVFLKESVDEHVWSGNLNRKDVKLYVANCFWRDVLNTWSDYMFCKPVNKGTILNQPIWLNTNVRLDDKPLFNKRAMECGLVKI